MPSESNSHCLFPGPRVLILCAAILAAGYVVLVMRGPAPCVDVRVNFVPAAEAPTP